jgi:nucleoid DNA-binding protein
MSTENDMSRTDLAAQLARKCDLGKGASEEITKQLFEAIKESLAKPGDRLHIHGFGTFELRTLASRSGKSAFHENKPWTSPAKNVIRFKPSKTTVQVVEDKKPSKKSK